MGLSIRALRSPLLAATDLDVADGEAISIQGASGSGKTLLLRAIADLDPNEGEVAVGQHRRREVSGPQWRRWVRYAASEPGWWAETVGEHFRDRPAAARQVAELGLTPECMDWTIARLSTGEKQRLAFLRCLEDNPPVLLLDEPTAALDETASAAVETIIRQRLQNGVSVLLVTHSDLQAERLAARQFEMQEGALRQRR